MRYENGWTVFHGSFKDISKKAVRDGRALIISQGNLKRSGMYGEK